MSSSQEASVIDLVRRELHRIEDRAIAANDGTVTDLAALRVALWRHQRAFRTVVQPLLAADEVTRARAERASGEMDALQARLDELERRAPGEATAAAYGEVAGQLQRYLGETVPALLDLADHAVAPKDAAALAVRYREAGRRQESEHASAHQTEQVVGPAPDPGHDFPAENTPQDQLAEQRDLEAPGPDDRSTG